ncbi:MAG: RNA polymerase subunit sigma-24 [Sorangium cellulosum]|nr:MAG: RNA polymerase subunit sigma-24 [Sorangium cellulosum]
MQDQTPKVTAFAFQDSSIGQQLVSLQPELRAHALRLTQNMNLAEDLVQDTVERALRFEDRFECGTNLRAWIHRILTNLFITRCRRVRREDRALQALSSDPCAWMAFHQPTEVGLSLSRSTQRAINNLPPMYRDTLVLIDVDDFSYKAAARQLGVPIGTVMSRLHRGRRLLADALREPMAEAA